MRREDGFTVIEMAVAALIGVALLGLAGTLLVGVQRTGLFAQGQSVTLNDARNAAQEITKKIRSADNIRWCGGGDGSCLRVEGETPTTDVEEVRYTYSSSALWKEVYDPGTDTWSDPQLVVDRVANDSSQPVFACDTQSTYLRVNIDLHIEPTPQSDPQFNVSTSVRPRNYGETPCPSS